MLLDSEGSLDKYIQSSCLECPLLELVSLLKALTKARMEDTDLLDLV